MNPTRRRWLQGLAAALPSARAAAPVGMKAARPIALTAALTAAITATLPARLRAATAASDDPVRSGRAIQFPRDHGAHPGASVEWWYATGWLGAGDGAPQLGFQLTFFRSRTGLAAQLISRFAPRQLLFAHAALSDLAGQRHHHDQRIVRWNGAAGAGTGAAALADGQVVLGPWSLQRTAAPADAPWQARLPARGFGLALRLQPTQPPLLQGDAGWSRKGPQDEQASHYYSLPQLAVRGTVTLDGRARVLTGKAWLDHEWSDHLLHPDAVGWDWIGMNLSDGSALTAFVLRRADGSALWAGGSWRRAGQPSRSFEAGAVQWQPGRRWRSPTSGAHYPVEWRLATPVGAYRIRALLDAQELDANGSTGSVYWEGLSELLDDAGRRVGLGYLEMTGYAAPMKV